MNLISFSYIELIVLECYRAPKYCHFVVGY